MSEKFFEKSDSRRAPEKTMRPENYFDRLESMLQRLSEKINTEHGELVNSDCSINERGFSPELYSLQEVESDSQLQAGRPLEINDKSRPFWIEKVVKRLRINPEAVTDEMIQSEFRRGEKKKHGFIAEMAVTGILHKALRERYLVTRSSNFDDKRNGIDNVIVDRETGTVVCAFDDVQDESDGGRETEKIERIKKKAREGGSQIKYGLTFESDPTSGKRRLIKKGIRNIPTFYLRLSREELMTALSGMNFDPTSTQTGVEQKTFSTMIAQIKEQMAIIRSENPKSPALAHMDHFWQTIQEMNNPDSISRIAA